MPRRGTSLRNVQVPHYDSDVRVVLQDIERILGDGRQVRLGSEMKPAKMARLARFGLRALRWDDLTEKQTKEMERLIPYKRTSLVEYAKDPIVVGTVEQWKKREAVREADRQSEEDRQQREYDSRRLSRELGGPVDDTYEDLPEKYERTT